MGERRVKIFLIRFLGILLLALLPLNAMADFTKTKVAVLDFQLQGKGYDTEDMGMIVAEWFITALVKTGRFDVIERALLQRILEEQKMSMSGILDESSATKFGKILGVKVIISGSVMKLHDVLEINSRIIDVETGSIIAAESVRSAESTDLQNLVSQMSARITKNFPLEGYVVSRQENTAIIDLGKIAGVRPDMEFMVYREGEVLKHPRTGEVLDVEKIKTGKLKIIDINSKIATCTIIEEESSDPIAIGQMVKSISGPLTPVSPPAPRTVRAKPSAPHQPASTPSHSAPIDSKSTEYIAKIQSKAPADKIYGAKLIARHSPKNIAVYDAVEKELLAIYNMNPDDKFHVDAVAWLTKALAASHNQKYRQTLQKVAKEATNKKVRKYAQKSLSTL